MAVQLPGKPYHGLVRNGAYIHFQEKKPEIFHSSPGWYLSRKEVEDHSPSRRDGIDFKKETQLRKLYCSFLQDLGMKLKVPQVTIATSMIFCHRFYLRQSHAKNEWQTMSTVCMFLAAKVEETPRLLREVVIVAYELMYKRDPAAAQRIKRKEIYEQQKELVLLGERLLLATIGFDLNVQHPYKPLVAALKKFKIEQNDLAKVAWNFVNDWLRTTLCLQFKPHYIAAGSIFLAAKFHKVKLPLEKGLVWWHEFDVTPRQLEEVIQQMLEVFEQNRRSGAPNECEKPKQSAKVVEKAASNSPQSCALSGSVLTCNSSHAIGREIGRETSANSMYQNSLGSWNLANSDILIAGKCKLQTDKSDWCSRIVSGPVSTCSQSCGTDGQVVGGTSVNLMNQNSLENWNSSYNGIKLTRKEESQSQTSNWHSCITSGTVLTCNSSHESNRDIREETYANSINSLCNRNEARNGIPVVTEGELQCLSIDWQSSVISRSLSTCNSSYQTDGEMRRNASGNLINQSSVVNQNTAYNAIQNTVEREIQSQASNWHSCVTSGSVLTCNSSYEPNRDVGGVTCASLLNQNSIGSQSLACQIDDWDSCAKGRSEITFNSSYGTIREVEGDTANLVSQIALGQQDLAYNDTLLAGRGEMHSQISDCGSTLRVTNVLNSYEKSDEREPEQITVGRDGEETVKLETSDFGCGALSKIDMVRIRATLRKRRGEMKVIKKMDAVHNGDDDDAWIESELENGIEITSVSEKKQRLV